MTKFGQSLDYEIYIDGIKYTDKFNFNNKHDNFPDKVELNNNPGLFLENPDTIRLLFKMQGLLESPDIDFMTFRRTVFECCSFLCHHLKHHKKLMVPI